MFGVGVKVGAAHERQSFEDALAAVAQPAIPVGRACDFAPCVVVNDAGLSYAVTGVAIDRDEERAHGQDERLGVQSFYIGNEFYYRYMKLLTEK